MDGLDSPNTLPGCFSQFENPISPNSCASCKLKVWCKKCVPRSKLKKIKGHIGKIELLLQDAMNQLTIGGGF